jgi:hypothetical protein
MAKRDDLKVGDKLWFYDENRRRYDKDGRHPIWRDHWVERVIVGETSRSWMVWLVGTEASWSPLLASKLPKAAFRDGRAPRLWARSVAEIERQEWVRTHRYPIQSKVAYCEDYDVLVQIAKLVGYSADGAKGAGKRVAKEG